MDDEIKDDLIFCKMCGSLRIKYNANLNMWACSDCNDIFNISDEIVYKLYRKYGVRKLKYIIGMSSHDIKMVVGRYFKTCCVSNERCVYKGMLSISYNKAINKMENTFESEKNKIKELLFDINNYYEKLDTEFKKLCFDYYTTLKYELEHYIYSMNKLDLLNVKNCELEHIIYDKGDLIWNYFDYNDNSIIGLSTVPYNIFSICEQRVERFYMLQKYFYIYDSNNELDYMRMKTISILLEKNEIFQCDLWRYLDIDSRKCTRVLKDLLDDDIICRDAIAHHGARTYLIKIKK